MKRRSAHAGSTSRRPEGQRHRARVVCCPLANDFSCCPLFPTSLCFLLSLSKLCHFTKNLRCNRCIYPNSAKNSPRIVQPFHRSSRTSFLQCHTLSMRFVTSQLAVAAMTHVCTPALSLLLHGVADAGANIAIGSQVRTFNLSLLSGVGALRNS